MEDLKIYRAGNDIQVDIGVPVGYSGVVEAFPEIQSPSGAREETKAKKDIMEVMRTNTNLRLRLGYILILERLFNCFCGVEGTVDEAGKRLGYL